MGTTYSLDLTALLLAPLSFALFDESASDDVTSVDPIRLLEAVRAYATIGEMCDALRVVWGEYVEEPVI